MFLTLSGDWMTPQPPAPDDHMGSSNRRDGRLDGVSRNFLNIAPHMQVPYYAFHHD